MWRLNRKSKSTIKSATLETSFLIIKGINIIDQFVTIKFGKDAIEYLPGGAITLQIKSKYQQTERG